jgi:hypothetical protein
MHLTTPHFTNSTTPLLQFPRSDLKTTWAFLKSTCLVGLFHDAASAAEFMSDNSECKTSEDVGSLSLSDGLGWTEHRDRISDVGCEAEAGGRGGGGRQGFLFASSLCANMRASYPYNVAVVSVARDDPFPQPMIPTMWSVTSSNVYANVTWHLDKETTWPLTFTLSQDSWKTCCINIEHAVYTVPLTHVSFYQYEHPVYTAYTRVNMEHAVYMAYIRCLINTEL